MIFQVKQFYGKNAFFSVNKATFDGSVRTLHRSYANRLLFLSKHIAAYKLLSSEEKRLTV